jgi:hypothetical protein
VVVVVVVVVAVMVNCRYAAESFNRQQHIIEAKAQVISAVDTHIAMMMFAMWLQNFF